MRHIFKNQSMPFFSYLQLILCRINLLCEANTSIFCTPSAYNPNILKLTMMNRIVLLSMGISQGTSQHTVFIFTTIETYPEKIELKKCDGKDIFQW